MIVYKGRETCLTSSLSLENLIKKKGRSTLTCTNTKDNSLDELKANTNRVKTECPFKDCEDEEAALKTDRQKKRMSTTCLTYTVGLLCLRVTLFTITVLANKPITTILSSRKCMSLNVIERFAEEENKPDCMLRKRWAGTLKT